MSAAECSGEQGPATLAAHTFPQYFAEGHKDIAKPFKMKPEVIGRSY